MAADGAVTAVVVGSRDDEHARQVTDRLASGTWATVDAESLTQRRYRLDRDGLWLGGSPHEPGDSASRIGPRSRGWLRRLAPPDWQRGVVLDTLESATKTSWLTLLTAFVRTSGVEWLTGLDALNTAENKMLQYRAALTLGVPTPRTAVVSDRACLEPGFPHRIVVKPLGPGHFTDPAGEGQVVFATAMSLDDPRLEKLPGAPFIVQELVEAHTHLRVVTVADRLWACVVDAADVPFDWRRKSAAQRSFRHVNPPGSIADGARELSNHFRLGYSSQDWIVDRSGKPWFLDLNPSGQWLFLPEPVSSAVSDAIADWLMRTETNGR